MEHESNLTPSNYEALPQEVESTIDESAIIDQLVSDEGLEQAEVAYKNVKNSLIGNILANTLLVAGVAGVMALALSKEQRLAIREGRDEGSCQFPHPHGDVCEGRLEVHHIMPQRYLKDKGYTEEEIDVPENLLTVCQHAHQNHIHLDIRKARKNYYKDKKSYEHVFKERDKALKEGKPYWNRAYDRILKHTAMQRTIEAMKEGWEYPLKKRR